MLNLQNLNYYDEDKIPGFLSVIKALTSKGELFFEGYREDDDEFREFLPRYFAEHGQYLKISQKKQKTKMGPVQKSGHKILRTV